jgi:hypothetical protein
MSNPYFTWSSNPGRLIPFDTARAEDLNTALDQVETGFDGMTSVMLVNKNAALKLADGENVGTIGNTAARAGKVLSFSAGGVLQTVVTVDNVNNAQTYANNSEASAVASAASAAASAASAGASSGSATASNASAVASAASAAQAASSAAGVNSAANNAMTARSLFFFSL